MFFHLRLRLPMKVYQKHHKSKEEPYHNTCRAQVTTYRLRHSLRYGWLLKFHCLFKLRNSVSRILFRVDYIIFKTVKSLTLLSHNFVKTLAHILNVCQTVCHILYLFTSLINSILELLESWIVFALLKLLFLRF